MILDRVLTDAQYVAFKTRRKKIHIRDMVATVPFILLLDVKYLQFEGICSARVEWVELHLRLLLCPF